MFTKVIVRFLKKRIVLAVIFCVSLLYCLSSLINEGAFGNEFSDSIKRISLPPSSFKWHEEKDKNSSATISCRNSVQGKVLVADDRGYVCQRSEVASTGCCNVELPNTKRYCCDTCQPNGCCSIYEYCISCCMQPQKIALLQKIMGKASETFKMLVASITDHFELCLTKCRTSSESVHHENSYRDPSAKHCYADEPPGQSRTTKSHVLKE
uniref:SREBP regulating gene protein n=1 Tax=Ixodes ricinus TaxID=34613 RepID=A0A131Y979_IXORI